MVFFAFDLKVPFSDLDRINIWFMAFDSITQFLAMICSVSVEGSLNRVAYSISTFFLLTLSESFLFNLSAFAACLPLSSA